MEKQMSDYAAAAKQIRVWLKAQGIKARVNSEGYSMGSSVRIEIYDQPPEVVEKVNAFAKQYQYGHFDGMQDLYEYSNSRKDIPQAKYVSVRNELSDELKQEIWDFAMAYYLGALENAPADAKAAMNFRIYDFNQYGSEVIYRMASGGYGDNQFWDFKKEQLKAVA